MTIDLNFRQSGKTTRLVADAQSHLGHGRAIIVTCNHQMAKHIEQMCLPFVKSKRLKFSTQYSINNDIRGLSDEYKRYWDEFMFMEEDNVIWRDGDYYCSSTEDIDRYQLDIFNKTGHYPFKMKR